MKVAALIAAAGRSRRFFSKVPKVFVPVRGKPLLVHTLERLTRSFPFEEVLLMVGRAEFHKTQKLLKRYGFSHVRLIAGGLTRAASVKRGFDRLSRSCDWVLVHDGARPVVDRALVLRTILAAKKTGAALCATPVLATVKKVDVHRGSVVSTEDRRALYLAQTPQVFRKDLLAARYQRLKKKALKATDEASLFDNSPVRVQVVEGDVKNIKVTTKEDLGLVKYYLGRP